MAANYSAEWVASFFDRYGVSEWERMVKTPVDEVSLHIHAYYLTQMVTPGARVLEVGAGAGRFTQILAQISTRVLVVDISQVQLDLNRAYAQQFGFADAVENWRRLDMCHMDELESASFDCVVAYGGPFSYALDQRTTALKECVRLIRPGGLLFASVISLWGTAHERLQGVMAIPAEQNRRILASGDVLPGSFEAAKHFMHMFRAAEFQDFLRDGGLTIEAISSSGTVSVNWGNLLSEYRQDSEKWNMLLGIELEASAEPGSWNAGTHLIGVARKPHETQCQ